jgi:hypothetical protein
MPDEDNPFDGELDPEFFDYSNPEKMMEALRRTLDGERNPERFFDLLLMAMVQSGKTESVHNITTPYKAALFTLGEDRMARALRSVMMIISPHNIMVGYSIYSCEHIDPPFTPAEANHDKMNQAMLATLKAGGAICSIEDDGGFTITGWDNHDDDHEDTERPVGQRFGIADIEKAVSEFRVELDTELGDSDNPLSRWMPRKGRKEDQ